MAIIHVADLPEKVVEAFGVDEITDILAGLNSKAMRVAPCLADDPSESQMAEAKLLLLGTMKRWADAGAGALSQLSLTGGPFTKSESYDTRQRTGYNLWPSEIAELQDLCASGGDSDAAFMVDMTPEASPSMWTRPDLWFQWVQPTPHDAP